MSLMISIEIIMTGQYLVQVCFLFNCYLTPFMFSSFCEIKKLTTTVTFSFLGTEETYDFLNRFFVSLLVRAAVS